MGPDHFCDKRVKLADQFTSCFIIVLQRSLNQRACVTIVHVVKIASTPTYDRVGGVLVTPKSGSNVQNRRRFPSSAAPCHLEAVKRDRFHVAPLLMAFGI